MYLIIAWLAWTGLLAPLPEQPKPDIELLQGRWIVVSAERGGEAEDQIKGDVLEIAKDQVVIHAARNDFKQKGNFKLDPSKKPKTIDLNMAAPDANGRTVTIQGIYELAGDALTICLCPPGGQRPEKFATQKTDDQPQGLLLVRLKREMK